MARFLSESVEIEYEVTGAGPPVLLIHGFASRARVNWWNTGWVKVLADGGFKVITFDNRGHGLSTKLYEAEAYRLLSTRNTIKHRPLQVEEITMEIYQVLFIVTSPMYMRAL